MCIYMPVLCTYIYIYIYIYVRVCVHCVLHICGCVCVASCVFDVAYFWLQICCCACIVHMGLRGLIVTRLRPELYPMASMRHLIALFVYPNPDCPQIMAHKKTNPYDVSVSCKMCLILCSNPGLLTRTANRANRTNRTARTCANHTNRTARTADKPREPNRPNRTNRTDLYRAGQISPPLCRCGRGVHLGR